MRRMLMANAGGGLPAVLVNACNTYGIPIANMKTAYDIDNDIVKSFDGSGRCLINDKTSYYVVSSQKISDNTEFYIDAETLSNNDVCTFGITNFFFFRTFLMFGNIFDAGIGVDWGKNQRRKINISKEKGLIIDGTKYKDCSSVEAFVSNYNLIFFARVSDADGSLSKQGVSKFYLSYIKQNSVLEEFLIPFNHPTKGSILLDITKDAMSDAAYPKTYGNFHIE